MFICICNCNFLFRKTLINNIFTITKDLDNHNTAIFVISKDLDNHSTAWVQNLLIKKICYFFNLAVY